MYHSSSSKTSISRSLQPDSSQVQVVYCASKGLINVFDKLDRWLFAYAVWICHLLSKRRKTVLCPAPCRDITRYSSFLAASSEGGRTLWESLRAYLAVFPRIFFSIFHKQNAFALLLLLFSSPFYLNFKFLCGGEICCLLKTFRQSSKKLGPQFQGSVNDKIFAFCAFYCAAGKAKSPSNRGPI